MPKVEEMQEELVFTEARSQSRDERLASYGVSVPTGWGAAPLRTAGRRRPKWLALILRSFS
jgi:hypothetical protein